MSLARDLVGAEIMSGDPGAVSLLARRMSHLAEDVNGMRDKFTARYLGGIWEGEAFEAFAKTLEDVPKDLEKVGTSYGMASHALSAYSRALDRVQQAARELAHQATDAESRVNAAEGDRARAQREVRLAKAARSQAAADPVALQNAQRRLQLAVGAVAAAEARHGQATSELADVRSRACQAVDDFKDEVRLCCQRLHDASEAGIQNTVLSAYNRHVADTPLGIVLGPIFSPIAELPGHLMALAKDFGDLEARRGVLAFLGTVILVATIVVVVIGTGGLALVALGVAGAAVAGASLAVDHARVSRGELSPDALKADRVALGLSVIPGAGALARFAPAALKAGRTVDQGWKTRFVRYGGTGDRMTLKARAEELGIAGLQTYVPPEVDRESRRSVVAPRGQAPCVAPQAGLGASPAGVIRHMRPINPRPIALAGAG